ncbi:MAG: hypothetical protein WBV62_17810 [Roseobacter sp.]
MRIDLTPDLGEGFWPWAMGDAICVHGNRAAAVDLARDIRARLSAHGVRISSSTGLLDSQ